MKTKLKLPFDALEKEFPVIMSREDLKSILGGTYGGPSYDWDTPLGFLNNVSEMMSNGMFNYTGSSNFSGEYNLSSLSGGSGSGTSNINFFGDSGSGSGTSVWSYGSGSGGGNSNGVYVGSADLSGSNLSAAPVGIRINGWDGNVKWEGLQNPVLNIAIPGGYNFKFELKPKASGATERKFNFSFTYDF